MIEQTAKIRRTEKRSSGIRKTVREHFPKILAAFGAGLALFAGCAYLYSRLQERELSKAVRTHALPTQAEPTVELPIQSLPVINLDIRPVSKRKAATNVNLAVPEVSQPPVAQLPSATENVDSNPSAAVPPPTQAEVSKPVPMTAPAGAVLAVRLGQELSTKRNHTGETFRGTLASPLIVNGTVIAKANSMVLGRIIDSKEAHLLHGHSDLSLVLTDITTADDQLVKVQTTQWDEKGARNRLIRTADFMGSSKKGSSKKDTDSDSGEHLSKKRTVVIPAGAQVQFRLIEPITVTP